RPTRDEHPGNAAEERQHERLREQLPDELEASSTNREPDCHFACPGRRSGEQQVRDIGARDDQHERRDRKQQPQRRRGPAWNGALAAAARLHKQWLRPKPCKRLIAHALLERRLYIIDDGPILRLEHRMGSIKRHSWLQASEEIERIRAPVLEAFVRRLQKGADGQRHAFLRLSANRRALEAAGCNADDGECLSVDRDRLIEDARIRTELCLPVAVAENDYWRLTWGWIIARTYQAAKRGLEAQRREVAS